MTTLAVIAASPGTIGPDAVLAPCSVEETNNLAEAALADTIAAVSATPADRRVLILDGAPGRWIPDGFEIVPQASGNFSERVGAAFADTLGHVRDPMLLIGTNTPQLTATMLGEALHSLKKSDAVVGPAADGGFWSIGLHAADRRAFEGVSLRRADSRRRQEERLRAMGLRVTSLREMIDVETFDDALAVSQLAPQSWFAAAVRGLADTITARDAASMPTPDCAPSALVVDGSPRPLGRAVPTTTPPNPVLDVSWGPLLNSLFDPAAPTGRFASALLPDGVIGAGAAPLRVLRRVGALLHGGGRAIAELDAPGTATEPVEAWLECGDGRVGPLPWCAVTPDTIEAMAGPAGLRLASEPVERGGRWFASLERV